jgi:hypothetical protein
VFVFTLCIYVDTVVFNNTVACVRPNPSDMGPEDWIHTVVKTQSVLRHTCELVRLAVATESGHGAAVLNVILYITVQGMWCVYGMHGKSCSHALSLGKDTHGSIEYPHYKI